MTCPHLPDVWALYDEELDDARAAAVQRHLAACPECREELRALHRLSDVLRQGDVTVDTSPQRHEQMKQALRERCGLSPAAGAAEVERREIARRIGPLAGWIGVLRRRPSLSPAGRRVYAAALSVLLVAALSLIFAGEAPAQTLEKVLNAMAHVRSAHCAGWFVAYFSRDRKTGPPLPGRMKSEWWYRAPDRFRRNQGPEVPGGVNPGSLIINGRDGVFISQYHAERGKLHVVSPQGIARYLSPLDFFSTEGLLSRARREKKASVSEGAGSYRGRKVAILTVVVEEVSTRHRWVLYVDPYSNLIRRSEWTLEQGTGTGSEPLMKEVLEGFQYEVPVDDRKFRLAMSPPREPSTAPERLPEDPGSAPERD